MKEKKKLEQQKGMRKQSIFQQATGSETRVLPKRPLSEEMSDFTKSLYFLSLDKYSIA